MSLPLANLFRRLIYVISGDLEGKGTLVEYLEDKADKWKPLRQR